MNGLLSPDDRKKIKEMDNDYNPNEQSDTEQSQLIPTNQFPNSQHEILVENQTKVSTAHSKIGKPNKAEITSTGVSFSEELKRETQNKMVSEEDITTNEEVEETVAKMDTPEESHMELCKQCVIRDLVGCDRCGIFIYGYRHKQFKISVEKI